MPPRIREAVALELGHRAGDVRAVPVVVLRAGAARDHLPAGRGPESGAGAPVSTTAPDARAAGDAQRRRARVAPHRGRGPDRVSSAAVGGRHSARRGARRRAGRRAGHGQAPGPPQRGRRTGRTRPRARCAVSPGRRPTPPCRPPAREGQRGRRRPGSFGCAGAWWSVADVGDGAQAVPDVWLCAVGAAPSRAPRRARRRARTLRATRPLARPQPLRRGRWPASRPRANERRIAPPFRFEHWEQLERIDTVPCART